MFDLLHSFVNIFAGGRSDIKTILFFVYATILLATWWMVRRINSSHKLPKLQWRWFLLILAVSYLYGLTLHLIYTISRNLSPFDFLVVAKHGELSSTIIWHMHEFKAVIGGVLSAAGINDLRTSDGGGAYVGELPVGLLIVGFMLLIAMLVSTAVYFVYSFVLTLRKKHGVQAVVSVLFYAVATFSLIKAAVDGGMLTPQVAITAVFVWLYWRVDNGWRPGVRFYYGMVGSISLLTMIGLVLLQQETPTLIGASVAATAALYGLLLFLAHGRAPWRYLVVLAALLLAAWLAASTRDQEIAYYSYLELKAGQMYLVYDDNKRTIGIKKTDRPRTIRQISNDLQKNVSYSPVSAPGVTCFENGIDVRLQARLKTTAGDALTRIKPTDYIRAINIKQLPGSDTYGITFLLDPCTPEPLSSLNGYLINAGVKHYVLINPTIGENDAGFE